MLPCCCEVVEHLYIAEDCDRVNQICCHTLMWNFNFSSKDITVKVSKIDAITLNLLLATIVTTSKVLELNCVQSEDFDGACDSYYEFVFENYEVTRRFGLILI